MNTQLFHLPGLFEFFDFYKAFLPVFFDKREWFYESAAIGSIYGAPADCLWGGGRAGFGKNGIEKEVYSLLKDFSISARLTFSNSLLEKQHLDDRKCNRLCELFCSPENGIIIHSDLLKDYLKYSFPLFYFVSSTTKVITDFDLLLSELQDPAFRFVVPDFRFNKDIRLFEMDERYKKKTEFLVNECCWFDCRKRKECYEQVSRLSLGQKIPEWKCCSPEAENGYKFSSAKKSPGFISVKEIQEKYSPAGFSDFKIEGRSLGSALLLEFILYYMTKPEYHLELREALYLDNTLDLF